MSYGTSDTTVISSTKTEAHNLNTTNASAAQRDGLSPATIFTTTPENRQVCNNPVKSWHYRELHTFWPITFFWRINYLILA